MYRSVSVDVDVHIDEFDDADILGEAKDRGFCVSIPKQLLAKMSEYQRKQIEKLELDSFDEPDEKAELLAVLTALRAGKVGEADWLLERMIYPKFHTFDECQNKYKEIRAASIEPQVSDAHGFEPSKPER